jgi:hypothetical protein
MRGDAEADNGDNRELKKQMVESTVFKTFSGSLKKKPPESSPEQDVSGAKFKMVDDWHIFATVWRPIVGLAIPTRHPTPDTRSTHTQAPVARVRRMRQPYLLEHHRKDARLHGVHRAQKHARATREGEVCKETREVSAGKKEKTRQKHMGTNEKETRGQKKLVEGEKTLLALVSSKTRSNRSLMF